MSIQSFLENLGQQDTNIPISTSWEVEFEIPGGLDEVSDLEGQGWGDVGNIPGGNIKLLAQTVQHVGDNYGPGEASITNNGGLLPGVISNGRAGASNRTLAISFLETEKTLADLALRAWVIVAAHYGRIADRNDLKTTLYVTHLGRDGSPRKTFKYFNSTPAAVEGLSYSYGESKIDTIATTWVYDNYSVS
jgi:hypothetical protein